MCVDQARTVGGALSGFGLATLTGEAVAGRLAARHTAVLDAATLTATIAVETAGPTHAVATAAQLPIAALAVDLAGTVRGALVRLGIAALPREAVARCAT